MWANKIHKRSTVRIRQLSSIGLKIKLVIICIAYKKSTRPIRTICTFSNDSACIPSAVTYTCSK